MFPLWLHGLNPLKVAVFRKKITPLQTEKAPKCCQASALCVVCAETAVRKTERVVSNMVKMSKPHMENLMQSLKKAAKEREETINMRKQGQTKAAALVERQWVKEQVAALRLIWDRPKKVRQVFLRPGTSVKRSKK